MKMFLAFILLINLAYAANECSINEKLPSQGNFDDLEKIISKVSHGEFSDRFCRAISVCYSSTDIKGTCDFFDSLYKQALQSLDDQSFGTCGLSKEELTVLSYYTTAGFGCLNSHLRGSKTDPQINYLVEVMDRALKKFPAYRGLVRRGTVIPDAIRDQYVKGGIVSDPAFISSSSYQGFAFKKDQMIILSKTGSMIMTLNSGSENEIIFSPGTKFRVISVKSVKENNYYILREVSEGIKDDISDEKILDIVKNMPAKQDYFVTDKWTCPENTNVKIPKKFEQTTTPDLVGFER